MSWPDAFTFMGSISSVRWVWLLHVYYAMTLTLAVGLLSATVYLLWRIRNRM